MARRCFRVLTKASEPPFTRDDGRELIVDYMVYANSEAEAREYAILNAMDRAEARGHAPFHVALIEEVMVD